MTTRTLFLAYASAALPLLAASAQAQAPLITAISAPRQVVTKGQSLTLGVSATGATSYQWRRRGQPIAGATASSYTIASASSLTDNGWYQAVATNGSGSSTSAVVFVNVAVNPAQILAWGDNTSGQTAVPPGLSHVVSVAAGEDHSVALKADGTVAAWGRNDGGQATVPANLDNVVAIAAGGYRSLALRSDGTVAVWGANYYNDATVPASLGNVVSIAAGLYHNLALKADGTVVAWGLDDEGQATVPANLTNIVAIATGERHNLAVRTDGTVVAWGRNDWGQATVPAGLSNVTSAAAAASYSVVVKADGTAVAWGNHYDAQMTQGLTNVASFAASPGRCIALKTDGSIVAWGTTVPTGVANAVGIATSAGHSLVVRDASADSLPTITTQPVAVTVIAGSTATLTVAATSTPPPTYQWRKFGVPIAGATTASLALSSVALGDAGYYDVVVSCGLVSTVSKPARVDVVPPLASHPTVLRPRTSAPRVELGGANALALAVDASDGKLYVAGEFTRVNGQARLNIARFNADGTFDSSWSPAAVMGGSSIRAILVEPDGVIIAGEFTSIGGVPRGRIAKLSKTTGALDPAFASGPGASSNIYALARQTMADGSSRYLIGGSFSYYDNTNVNRLVRIDATGARDPAFTIAGSGSTGFNNDVRALAIDGTGTAAKIYAGGLFTSHFGVTANRNRLVRLDASGNYDATFDIGSGFGSDVRALALQTVSSSTRIVVGGLFSSFNGTTTNRNRVVRLTDTGAFDTAFDAGSGFNNEVRALAVDSANRVYVAGNFNSFNGTTSNVNGLLRLTTAGARDTDFNNGNGGASGGFGGGVNAILLREADSQLVLGGAFATWNGTARSGLARVSTTAAGTLDSSLAPSLRRPGFVMAIEPAPNGKWYVGGGFHFIDDTAINHFARLNADGTFDSTFALPGTGFSNDVNAIVVQGDGRILVGGFYSSFNGVTRTNLARLNPDGTLDSGYDPGTSFNGRVSGLVLLPDGRLIAAGSFTTYNGVTRNRLARLNSDGTLDTTFDPAGGFTGGVPTPAALAMQSDGRLLVGGTFTSYNGTTANGLVRILSSGEIDPDFNPGGAGFASSVDVRALATRLNDKIVAAGNFTSYNGTSRGRIAWLDGTGTLDSGFTPSSGASGSVTALHVQSDTKTLLAGYISSINGTARAAVARVNADGSTDTSFAVPTALQPNGGAINVLRPLPDGNLIVGATRIDFAEFAGRGTVVVLEAAPVPVIATQPTNVVGSLGGTATFTVGASGESLQYQWVKNGAPIIGATTATLTLNNLTLSDTGTYSVNVFNLYGAVSSAAATLTGSGIVPTITTQPVAATTTIGGNASFTVAASGGGALVYQWRKFGVPIAGATSATLALSAVGLEAAGYYDVFVSDGLSGVVSRGGRLTVSPAPAAVALQPRAAFEPRVESSGVINALAVLSDGRFYAAGIMTSVEGTIRHSIARFLADGTLDGSWAPAVVTGDITSLAVQSDGKLVIGGTFVWFGTFNSFRLARLNPDGSIDTSFNIGSGFHGGQVNAVVIQPTDQKIVVGGVFTDMNGTPASRIIRLNSDGTPDRTFVSGGGFDGTVNTLALQTDGKIVAGGAFANYNGAPVSRVARLEANGALDSSFATGAGFNDTVSSLAIQPSDGKIIVGGAFTVYNHATVSRLVRLAFDGTRDASFPAGSGFGAPSGTTPSVTALALQSSGSVLAGGNFTSVNGMTVGRLARFDGTTGAPDTTFAANLGAGFNSNSVNAIAVQPSGAILAGGSFNALNNVPRFALARLAASGVPDAAFTAHVRRPGNVYTVLPVAGGRFLVGGSFSHVGGMPATNLACIDASGALDSSFTSGGPNGPVRGIVAQGDGRFIIAGNFTGYHGVTTGVTRIARISAAGVLDPTFGAGSGFNGSVNALAQTPDGGLVAGGTFTTYAGVTANRIAQLTADGTPDTGFVSGTGFNANVNALVVRSDGRIVAGGSFGTYNNSPASALAQLLPTGSLDPSFALGTGFALDFSEGAPNVTTLLLQPDDKVLATGGFSSYNGTLQLNLARLLPNGAPDLTFATGWGFNGAVTALMLQSDGAIIAAGRFTSVGGQRRSGLARVSATGVLDLAFGAHFANGTPSHTINILQPLADGTLLVGSTGHLAFRGRMAGGLTLFEPVPSLPVILVHPFGGSFPAGSTTSVLSVIAATGPNATYQWKRDGIALTESLTGVAGVTSNVLRFMNAQAGDAGTYTVTITDGASSVTSDPVIVTIAASAPISDGVGGPFCAVQQANTASLVAVEATGSAPITWQWRKDGANLSGGFGNINGAFGLPLSPLKPADAGTYGVTLTNALGSVTPPPLRLWVTEESGWTWHSPMGGPNELISLAVVDGKFVAGGRLGARIASTDGLTWTQLPSLSHNSIYGIVAGNNRRLILGDLGFTAVSADGVTWKTGTLGVLEPTQDAGATFGNGLFVIATGEDGKSSNFGKIFTSPDGEVWTERYATPMGSLHNPVFANGTLAVVRANGTGAGGLIGSPGLLRSADGISWTEHPLPADANGFGCASGLFFLGRANGQLYTSTDALIWTPRGMLGGFGWTGIGYGAGVYVIAGKGGWIATSTDLATWTPRASGTLVDLRGVAFNNGTWLVTSAYATPNVILTSTDGGVTWTNRVTGFVPVGQGLDSAASDGTTELVVVGNHGFVARTTDGITWSTVASGVTEDLEHVVCGGGKYVAVGQGGRILRSSNGGTSWNVVTSPTSGSFGYLAWVNGQFFAQDNNGTLFRSADDAGSWTALPVPGDADAIAYGAGLYVVVGGNGGIYTSPDLAAWTTRVSGTTLNLEGVAFNGTLFVAGGLRGTLLTSSNGIDWTLRPALTDGDHGVDLIVGRFLTGGGNQGDGYLTSSDGLNWSAHRFGAGEVSGGAVFKDRIYVVTGGGAILSTSLAPTIKQQPAPEFFAIGSPAKFSVLAADSPLGVTYQWRRNGIAIAGATNATLTLASVQPSDAGNYDVVLANTAGNVTSNAAVLGSPPSVTMHPQSQAVSAGQSFTLRVGVAGNAPFTYQWCKDATPISGATNASYSVPGAQSADAGTYFVVVTNSVSSTSSNVALVTVISAGTTATHAAVGAGYVAGFNVTITNTINYTATATALSWDVLLPSGWTFARDTGNVGETRPTSGQSGTIGWAWQNPPPGPITFAYTVNVPLGTTGPWDIAAIFALQQGGDSVAQILAKPDPLVVSAATTHAGDTDRDFRLNLFELTRVIELYNTRNGTVRTGCYKVQDGTEDGFTADASRASGSAATLTRYHSADTRGASTGSPRNGAIDLFELTRVIELYNYRAGTVRTGQYHVQSGTEDGFAAGP